ncbi:MAG TPA: UDP-4-amino-4,6-dideoxy-N-acetyl-beta-L-altrosamine transaminase [Treponema sp.]|nr:UDP-4-amino-4,6-dideoxy-N-acetyl-beta-L-altrosamine transaminase [Treponema sp.]
MADCDSLKVPFFRASIGKDDEEAVLRVLHSGWLTTGKEALAFEQEFAAKIQVPYALAVNSNTSGMVLAMEACGVGAGKAVITTPYTFVSTAACARLLGADVYFADIEPDSYSIDPAAIEKILCGPDGKKVAAIVPVHIGGNVCDMDAIMALAKKYGVRVIEDCAHSFPSPTHLGYAGAIGDIGVFSFYVTKTITTGEGGMVTTKDEALARHMMSMRMHGMDRTTWDRYTSPKASWEYDIIAPGYKYNLPDLLAALGRTQLAKAEEFDRKRKAHVQRYIEAFRHMDFIKLPPDGEGNAWHLFLLRLDTSKLSCDRNTFARELQTLGVGISVHFIPIFHFSYWQGLYPEFTARNFPNAEQRYNETITIPLFPDMTDDMVDFVISRVKAIGEKYHA